MIPCNTCGQPATGEDLRCDTCRAVEAHLVEYMQSPKGQDFVRRKHLPKIDNWPEWDYEAVLRENEVEVEKAGKYWYTLGWRHGSVSINADNEIIARKSAAMFISLFLRGFTCSFADNIAHGYAMWLELQDRRYSFELTKDLGDAVIEMSDNGMGPDFTDDSDAWNKLVDSARLLRERER